MMRTDLLRPGVQLLTKRPERLTNAVYVKQDKQGHHVVVSDFGNEVIMTTYELKEAYELNEEYVQFYHLDYPIAPLRERWETQLELIQKQLNNLVTP